MDPEKKEFIQAVIFNALGCSPLELYKRLDYVKILEKTLNKTLDLGPFDPFDPEFYRKYLYVVSMVESDKSLDYFGPDYGPEDVLSFDAQFFKEVLQIFKLSRDFIGLCSTELKGAGDLDYGQ